MLCYYGDENVNKAEGRYINLRCTRTLYRRYEDKNTGTAK